MSALSKTFVVLVTLFSVTLVTLLVPFIVNQQNYQKQIDEANQNFKSAEIAAMLRANDIALLHDRDSSRMADAKAQIEGLQKQRSELIQAKHDAENDRRTAETAAKKATDQAVTSATTNKQLATILEDTKTELLARNDDLLKLSKQNIELSTQLEIEQSKVDQYAYQLKLLQEEITALSERNARIVSFITKRGLALALARFERILIVAYGDIELCRPLPGLNERHGATPPDSHKALPAIDPVGEHERFDAARVNARRKAGYLGVPSKVPAHAAIRERFPLVCEPPDIGLLQFQPPCWLPFLLSRHRPSPLVKSPQRHRW